LYKGAATSAIKRRLRRFSKEFLQTAARQMERPNYLKREKSFQSPLKTSEKYGILFS